MANANSCAEIGEFVKTSACTSTVLAVLAVPLMFSVGAHAQEARPAAQAAHTVTNLADVKWGEAPPSLPKGAQMAVMQGDAGQPALFTLLVKLPKGYKVPAHWHSTDEALTVLSGALYVGMGDKLDPAHVKPIKAGGFSFMPAKMHHFAFTKAPAMFELHAVGPFDITYIDPADDPRKK